MNYDEAKAWLKGERSMCNILMPLCENNATANVLIAEADAAMTQQAYWVVKAHQEGLVE